MSDSAKPPPATPTYVDPYDQPPSWVERHADVLWGVGVFVATVILTVVAFPPFPTAEFAYAFAFPALFWAYLQPSRKLYTRVVLGAQVVAWTIILGWLHHVTWGGLLLLGPVIGLWNGVWFLAAWWLMPRLLGRKTLTRLAGMFGLAALWVVIEWTRTWFLSGFPWLPLSASQWQRASILQIAAFTGAGGVSFVLIAMNIGFAAYAHRLLREGRRGFGRRSQEFLAALFLLLVCLALHVSETAHRERYTVPLGRFAFVQPFIPQEIKWDNAQAPEILSTLETLTKRAVAIGKPDVILWPEAVTPWALKGDTVVREWTEGLVRTAGVPLVLGSIAIEPPPAGAAAGAPEDWFNAVFIVDPIAGVQQRYYAKQKLVPFGEFVPFRPLLGWIGKFVPIGDDFGRGNDTSPLIVTAGSQALALGTLICYEDIFPSLARYSVLSGADVLTVHTNNGWFGEGGAAYQHAAHSVLRAVETRRPVLRVGNGGWSGWINEFGKINAVLTQDDEGRSTMVYDDKKPYAGTIYFRGTLTIPVTADARWISHQSFYVRYGDWFIAFCAVLAIWGAYSVRGPILPPADEKGEPLEPLEPLKF